MITCRHTLSAKHISLITASFVRLSPQVKSFYLLLMKVLVCNKYVTESGKSPYQYTNAADRRYMNSYNVIKINNRIVTFIKLTLDHRNSSIPLSNLQVLR